MLNLHSRLQPNREEVAAKVMDGEAIIINLTTGVYYSMDKVGGLMWELIDGGFGVEEIVTTVVARYNVSPEQVKTDAERLITELFEEKLVGL